MSHKKKKSLVSEDEILDALEARFEGRYFIRHPLFSSARPDALTVTLENLEIEGFEVKTTRQDWLAELRRLKNRAVIEVCDFWNIVASADVVKATDLPEGWGFYRVEAGPTLVLERTPHRLNPKYEIGRDLIDILLRSVIHTVPRDEISQKAYRKGYNDAIKAILSFPPMAGFNGHRLPVLMDAIERRVHFQFIKNLEELRDSVVSIFNSIDGRLKEIGPYKDWETGSKEPPISNDLLEKSRKSCLSDRTMSAMFQSDPSTFEKLVKIRAMTMMGWHKSGGF